jgi:hypothetical protein
MSTILCNLSWTAFIARRDLLTPDERQILFGVPTDRENLARHYMLSPKDLALIGARVAADPKTDISLNSVVGVAARSLLDGLM